MLNYELKHLKLNKKFIAGIDEAGRGPLAGPVVCACVVMPLGEKDIIEGVNDSKQLTEKKRNELYGKIIAKAISYKVITVDEKVVDEINILQATKKGMLESLNGLSVKPDVVLIDAVKLETDIECESIIKGDSLSYSIACASILAKVTRDNIMLNLHSKYPNYNFMKHKGYGTKEHIACLKQFGASEIHRKSFIKNFIEV